ncbi:MAG: hypothetical protein K2K04_02315, partial [Clostridia bacterium]|nr:hypothetical protein [Clostridia bacterium]
IKKFGEFDMKTQMKFQKILALVTLILAALSFVLGILFCSGIIGESRIYTSGKFTYTVKDPDNDGKEIVIKNAINADALFEYTQIINNVIVIMAIVFILVVLTLFITSTNKRRNYYVTNYVAIGLVVLYSFVFAICMIVFCSKCVVLAQQIDMKMWKGLVDAVEYDDYNKPFKLYSQNYSESYITMILGYILSALVLVDIAAWVLNLIWKIKLMKGEKELLDGGFVQEVA